MCNYKIICWKITIKNDHVRVKNQPCCSLRSPNKNWRPCSTGPWYSSGSCRKRMCLRNTTSNTWRNVSSSTGPRPTTRRRRWSRSWSRSAATNSRPSWRACSRISPCPRTSTTSLRSTPLKPRWVFGIFRHSFWGKKVIYGIFLHVGASAGRFAGPCFDDGLLAHGHVSGGRFPAGRCAEDLRRVQKVRAGLRFSIDYEYPGANRTFFGRFCLKYSSAFPKGEILDLSRKVSIKNFFITVRWEKSNNDRSKVFFDRWHMRNFEEKKVFEWRPWHEVPLFKELDFWPDMLPEFIKEFFSRIFSFSVCKVWCFSCSGSICPNTMVASWRCSRIWARPTWTPSSTEFRPATRPGPASAAHRPAWPSRPRALASTSSPRPPTTFACSCCLTSNGNGGLWTSWRPPRYRTRISGGHCWVWLGASRRFSRDSARPLQRNLVIIIAPQFGDLNVAMNVSICYL